MKLTIVATVLLGLLLTPALAFFLPSNNGNLPILNYPLGIRKQFSIGGAFQTLFLNKLVAVIEQTGPGLSWKTIWNYNTGYVATKVLPEGTCYISPMNRGVMPSFNVLSVLAEAARELIGQLLPEKQVTFVVSEPVNNLQPFGQEIFNMCNGFTTYMANEVQGPAYASTAEHCFNLNILLLLNVNYCRADLVSNYNPGYNPGFNPAVGI